MGLVDIRIGNSNRFLIDIKSFIRCIRKDKWNEFNNMPNYKEKLKNMKSLQFNLVTPQRDHCMPLK